MDRKDIINILRSHEDAEIEAKSARGGFPDSLWDTYSAFANTDGGVILLGVSERKDHSLVVDGLTDAQKMEKDFWNMVNNRQKVNRNIMTNHMVHKEQVEGRDILVVEVPRAERTARPVYKGQDPFNGTYRRYSDGDHLCTREAVGAMMRDASLVSMDATAIETMDMSVFCKDTVNAYRNVFRAANPNHLWNNLDTDVFLRRIKAVDMGDDGQYHPTEAGLLMFGYEYEITRRFPQYFLDYQEDRVMIGVTRWKDRIVSTSGDWSGNVFDFVFKVLTKLQAGIKIPFVMKGNQRVDDTPMHKLLREATTNCMVHADYNGRQGIVITKNSDGFVFANPGRMRISVAEAVSGGVSDPRNSTMLKMFSLIRFGERAGSGLNGIMHIWGKVFHAEAHISEKVGDVDRTTLTLPIDGHEQDIQAMLQFYDDPNEYSVEDFVSPNDKVQEPTVKVQKEDNKMQKGEFEVQETGFKVQVSKEKVKDLQDKVQKALSTASSASSKKISSVTELAILISEQPTATQQTLSEQLGKSLRTIKEYQDLLQKADILIRVGSKKTGEWKINL